MIYTVTYYDATGNPLLEVTFDASGARDCLLKMLTIPTFGPPEGGVDFKVRRVPEPPAAA